MAEATTLSFCLQPYKFMGHSQVTVWRRNRLGKFPRCPGQLYPKSGAISNWAEWSSANCCLSDLITAGCPLGIQSPSSAGWCCQGRQLRGILDSQASPWRVGRAKYSGKPSLLSLLKGSGSKQTSQKGVTGEQEGVGCKRKV